VAGFGVAVNDRISWIAGFQASWFGFRLLFAMEPLQEQVRRKSLYGRSWALRHMSAVDLHGT